MVEILPYANLTPDPQHSIVIGWWDRRDEADGSEQTIDVDDGPSISVTGDAVPPDGNDNGYRYLAEVDSLDAGTTYDATIDDERDVQIATLPEEQTEITIGITSDLHIDSGQTAMNTANQIRPLGDRNPTVLLLIGDCVSSANNEFGKREQENAEEWDRWFRDYLPGLRQNGPLVPQFWVPGNHEVGNNRWEGDDSDVNPETGWFQFWWRYPPEQPPKGENYGEINVTDDLQVIGIDTHSAYAPDIREWLVDAIDENATVVLPFHHAPIVRTGFRGADDDDERDINLSNYLKRHYCRPFADAGNVYAHFCGHVHVRGLSKPWTVVDDQPEQEEFFDLNVDGPDDDGYMILDQSSGTIQEWGCGYRNNYDAIDDWWVEYSEELNQFYTVEFSDQTMVVNEIDHRGVNYQTRIYVLDSHKIRNVNA